MAISLILLSSNQFLTENSAYQQLDQPKKKKNKGTQKTLSAPLQNK